ncbi:MAG: hypothetical protein L0228_15020 [Planctomycetes bacterium]|nr:hypothetical protein [Planctomycetota bacterium]
MKQLKLSLIAGLPFHRTGAISRRLMFTGGVVFVCALAIAGHPADAALITCTTSPCALKSDAYDTGYEVSWTSPDVSKVHWEPRDGAIGARTNQGSLIIEKTYRNLDPIVFTFTETKYARDFGLRITLREIVFNRTGFNWSGFVWRLQESGNVAKTDIPHHLDADHPWFAHFHNDNYAFSPFSNDPIRMQEGNNAPHGLQARNGILRSGHLTDWNPRGIGIHEFSMQQVPPAGTTRRNRVFNLSQSPIPVPEPVTLGLALLGLGALLPQCRRRGRRNRSYDLRAVHAP